MNFFHRFLLKSISLFVVATFFTGYGYTQTTGEHHYLYVGAPGVRNYLQNGGHGLLVFDMDNNFKFVRRIATGGLDEKGQPSNIKGIAVSMFTDCVYLTTLQSVICIDLQTDKKVWEKKYEGGCDRLSITPDGKTIYLPSLEGDDWKVLDAKTGNVIDRIVTHSRSHNTLCAPDGSKVYLEGLSSHYVTVVNTANNKIESKVGPFANNVRPFTIDGAQHRCFINADSLLGFETGDLQTGKKTGHVEVKGYRMGDVKRHGCPSHGIALTPDESELWLSDGFNESVHIFNISKEAPEQIASIKLSDQPGWVLISLDGRYALPSTGDIIDAHAKKIITRLTDETGAFVQSEKMVEIHFSGNKPVLAGDQFAMGRSTAVK